MDKLDFIAETVVEERKRVEPNIVGKNVLTGELFDERRLRGRIDKLHLPGSSESVL